MIVELGYKGVDKINDTKKVRTESGKGKRKFLRRKMRAGQRRRAGIKAKISHLKNDYRMNKNYYKGVGGDAVNVFLSVLALNLKLWMNDYNRRVKYFCLKLIIALKTNFRANYS